MADPSETVTSSDAETGDRGSLGESVLDSVYGELRRLARAHMSRESTASTLQPTALVHEVYLRLIGDGGVDWEDRDRLMTAAAAAMQRILVDRARARRRLRRGGDREREIWSEVEQVVDSRQSVDLLALDEALEELAGIDARMCDIVRLRYFLGLSIDEAAQALEISPRTVRRDWETARVWLHQRIGTRDASR